VSRREVFKYDLDLITIDLTAIHVLFSVFGLFAQSKIHVREPERQPNLFVHNDIHFLDLAVIIEDFFEVLALHVASQILHMQRFVFRSARTRW